MQDDRALGPLNNLLNKELSRKEFLLVLGTALISLTGIPTFLSVLTNQHYNPPTLDGFGGGDFGGNDVEPIHIVLR
jgi:hypothetical protein